MTNSINSSRSTIQTHFSPETYDKNPDFSEHSFPFEPFFEMVPKHRDLLFFIDLVSIIKGAKLEDRPRFTQILGKAIRENLPDRSLANLLSPDTPFKSFLGDTEMEMLHKLKEAIENPEPKL